MVQYGTCQHKIGPVRYSKGPGNRSSMVLVGTVQVLFLYGVCQYSTGSRQYVSGMVMVQKGQIRSGRVAWVLVRNGKMAMFKHFAT